MGIYCVEYGRRVLQQTTREVFGTPLLALGIYMILFTYHNINSNKVLMEVTRSIFMNKKNPLRQVKMLCRLDGRRPSNLRFIIRIPHRG